MKMSPYFIAVTLSVIANVYDAQATDVSGSVSGVWYSSQSPYNVIDDLTLPAGDTLVIEPGVRVQFIGPYQFLVNGILRAVGTVSDSIRFTTDTVANPNRWKGIRFIGASDSCLLAYCIVEDAHWSVSQQGNAGAGILCQYCSPTISNCTIQRNTSARDGGGINIVSSSARVIQCHVCNNYAPYGGGIEGGSFDETDQTNPLIEHCLVDGNRAGQGGGIAFWEGNIMVVSCTIVDNYGGDAGGIRLCCDAHATIENTIFVNNSVAAVGSWEGSRATMGYSCFWQNSVVGTPPTGFGTLVMANVNGDSCDQYLNIFLDPQFVNAAAGDYHLLSSSPCIDAGDPNLPRDPDSTRADMGAFPYYRPCLVVEPNSLEFGLLDLGADSVVQVMLHNPTSVPIPVTDVFCTLPDFSFDTAGLGGQVPPFAAYYLNVTFAPNTAGAYTDTLVIVAKHQCDTLIRIPLYGEADVILSPVDSLVIQPGPMNGMQLDWAPVTHSISGQPVQDMGYIIYGSITSSGPYVPFGYATTNTYLHPYILNAQATYFYRVTADVAAPGTRR